MEIINNFHDENEIEITQVIELGLYNKEKHLLGLNQNKLIKNNSFTGVENEKITHNG